MYRVALFVLRECYIGVLPPVPPIDNSGDWTTITTTTTTTTTTLTTTSGLGQQRSAGKFRSSMNRTCAADRHPLYYSNLSGRALWKELFPDVNLSSFNDSAKSMIRKHDMDQYLHEGWRRRAPGHRPATTTAGGRREPSEISAAVSRPNCCNTYLARIAWDIVEPSSNTTRQWA
jgi:hypothetical protein